jgi:methyl coenzyme M reductase alpha subunit
MESDKMVDTCQVLDLTEKLARKAAVDILKPFTIQTPDGPILARRMTLTDAVHAFEDDAALLSAVLQKICPDTDRAPEVGIKTAFAVLVAIMAPDVAVNIIDHGLDQDEVISTGTRVSEAGKPDGVQAARALVLGSALSAILSKEAVDWFFRTISHWCLAIPDARKAMSKSCEG